jgi:hypothetical protein
MIQKELPLQRSCEELFLKRAIFSTKQNTLDALRTELAIIVDSNDLTNHVALTIANEIQTLNDVTDFHFLLRYLTVYVEIIRDLGFIVKSIHEFNVFGIDQRILASTLDHHLVEFHDVALGPVGNVLPIISHRDSIPNFVLVIELVFLSGVWNPTTPVKNVSRRGSLNLNNSTRLDQKHFLLR